jgi:hypothetical protein
MASDTAGLTMRYPRLRFRFTVKWLMIVIALVATVLGGGRLWQRSGIYLREAKDHEALEQSCRELARSKIENAIDTITSMIITERRLEALKSAAVRAGVDIDISVIEKFIREDKLRALNLLATALEDNEFAAYHAHLRKKYEYLSTHPWTILSPDPPPPTPPPPQEFLYLYAKDPWDLGSFGPLDLGPFGPFNGSSTEGGGEAGGKVPDSPRRN